MLASAALALGALGCQVEVVAQPPTAIRAPASETAPAFALGADGNPDRLVVAFNSFFPSPSVAGWAHSTSGAPGSWSYCDTLTPGCGPSGGVVPLARGLLGLYDQESWLGDPGLVAGAEPGVAVMVNLVDTTLHQGSVNDAITASLSLDSGQTFVATEFVNDTNCVGSSVDQPAIALDPTVPGTRVWITWRHRGTDIGKAGGCIRGGDVDASGRRIRWVADAAPFPVETEFCCGVGGLLPQARGDVVTVVYANTNNTQQCDGSVGVVWLSITSIDGGRSWGRQAVIFSSGAQPTCLPTAENGLVQPGMRNFGFVMRPDGGTQYVAVPDDDATAMLVFRSLDDAISWEQLIRLAPGDGSLVFLPSLNIDDLGRLLLTFQSIHPDSLAVNTWAAAGPAIWVGPNLVAGPTPPPLGQPPTVLGDYNGIATFPRGAFDSTTTFFPTWARIALGIPRVDGAFVSVLP